MDDKVALQVSSLSPVLAAFDAAASVGHITHAADLLDIPQSSLSRRIKHLEAELGVALFQPEGRGVALTAQGRDLYERIHGLVGDLDNAVFAARQNADPDGGLVRFGFPLTLGPASVPAMLARFHRTAPRIRLHLVQAHGAALVQMLDDGRLDLAVVIPAPEGRAVTRLGSQPLRLHVAAGHPLADSQDVRGCDLVDEVFIANPPSYHLRQVFDRWAAAEGFSPRVDFEITEFETVRALVERGLGIALLPESEVPHPGLVSIAVADDIDRSIGLASGNHQLTAPAQRLFDFVVADWSRVQRMELSN